MATPLEVSRGTREGGVELENPIFILDLKRKSKKMFCGVNNFSSGDFSWEGGSTLPQNSNKPSQDL